MAKAKNIQAKRAMRNRNRLRRLANGRPRLCVERSHKNISAQIIDDAQGHTLVFASTLEKAFRDGSKGVAAASKIGAAIAERAKKAGVEDVVFDRGAFIYHGRIKALAEAARENGLKF